MDCRSAPNALKPLHDICWHDGNSPVRPTGPGTPTPERALPRLSGPGTCHPKRLQHKCFNEGQAGPWTLGQPSHCLQSATWPATAHTWADDHGRPLQGTLRCLESDTAGLEPMTFPTVPPPNPGMHHESTRRHHALLQADVRPDSSHRSSWPSRPSVPQLSSQPWTPPLGKALGHH